MYVCVCVIVFWAPSYSLGYGRCIKRIMHVCGSQSCMCAVHRL